MARYILHGLDIEDTAFAFAFWIFPRLSLLEAFISEDCNLVSLT